MFMDFLLRLPAAIFAHQQLNQGRGILRCGGVWTVQDNGLLAFVTLGLNSHFLPPRFLCGLSKHRLQMKAPASFQTSATVKPPLVALKLHGVLQIGQGI